MRAGVPQGRSHLDRHGAAAEREHCGLVHVQPRDRVERFADAKLAFPPFGEQLGDRTALVPFQLFVEVDEGAAEPGGDFAAEIVLPAPMKPVRAT